jgi:hypothetical protein
MPGSTSLGGTVIASTWILHVIGMLTVKLTEVKKYEWACSIARPSFPVEPFIKCKTNAHHIIMTEHIHVNLSIPWNHSLLYCTLQKLKLYATSL